MQGVFVNTRRFLKTVTTSLVPFGLSGFAASLAQNRWSDAMVTICNQGRIDINVIIGTEPALPLFTHNLDVAAWVSIKPGARHQVCHGFGNYDSGDGIEHSYLGFGFYNSQNQFIAGHAARLPDFGIFSSGTPILTAAGDRFCVRNTGMTYRTRSTRYSTAPPSAAARTIPADTSPSPPC
jgi:hypothetical protein